MRMKGLPLLKSTREIQSTHVIVLPDYQLFFMMKMVFIFGNFIRSSANLPQFFKGPLCHNVCYTEKCVAADTKQKTTAYFHSEISPYKRDFCFEKFGQAYNQNSEQNSQRSHMNLRNAKHTLRQFLFT
ncbi:hypothetical protein RCL_jg29228.t1 [Rhizophagus clarus]|uniref:Uncharacterized protein n=1 Tax=Rhizophagus clarus TaxID=94130 RepID=A0A8H3R2T2_9GLOM|nr:hypothetical protein RCL_jg29228.t1 [Rhizophagus clarus]